MERWKSRVAVVTGGSAGIGAATVRALLALGLRVVGIGRDPARLLALRDTLSTALERDNFTPLACDVSDEAAVERAFDAICASLGGVDVLVNCAGMLAGGQLLEMDTKLLQQLIQTNVMGTVYCTRRTVKSIRERQAAANVNVNVNGAADGHIFLLNSIVGHYVFNSIPGHKQALNLYPATKHALTALTEVLRQELREFETKIKVTSISPGLVDTDFVPELYKALPMLQAADVAAAVVYALGTPPHVQIHELIMKPLGEPF